MDQPTLSPETIEIFRSLLLENNRLLEVRFDRLEGRIEEVRTELKDEIRQLHVLLEDLRHQIQIVAEGVVANRELIERHRKEISAAFRSLDRRITVLEQRSA